MHYLFQQQSRGPLDWVLTFPWLALGMVIVNIPLTGVFVLGTEAWLNYSEK